MPNVGPLEIIVVLVIALIVLGPKRLPEMASSLGRGIREFKTSLAAADPPPLRSETVKAPAPEVSETDAGAGVAETVAIGSDGPKPGANREPD